MSEINFTAIHDLEDNVVLLLPSVRVFYLNEHFIHYIYMLSLFDPLPGDLLAYGCPKSLGSPSKLTYDNLKLLSNFSNTPTSL